MLMRDRNEIFIGGQQLLLPCSVGGVQSACSAAARPLAAPAEAAPAEPPKTPPTTLGVPDNDLSPTAVLDLPAGLS